MSAERDKALSSAVLVFATIFMVASIVLTWMQGSEYFAQ